MLFLSLPSRLIVVSVRRPSALCAGHAHAQRGLASSAAMSAGKKEDAEPQWLRSTTRGVTTLTMNRPAKLNAWTQAMTKAMKAEFARAAKDQDTKVLVLTGKGNYYSAGASVSTASNALMLPKTFKKFLAKENASIFDAFLDFPKPMLVAANGPVLGATCTSAALCDAILASDKAHFLTPFQRIGLTPEGCSTVNFKRIMGEDAARRMLHENWQVTPEEAVEIGLAKEVVPHDQLLDRAQALGEQWAKEGKRRWLVEKDCVDEYKEVNRLESDRLAESFLSAEFFDSQYKFLSERGKHSQARVFAILKATRPMWKILL